jgi:hypothetical protein
MYGHAGSPISSTVCKDYRQCTRTRTHKQNMVNFDGTRLSISAQKQKFGIFLSCFAQLRWQTTYLKGERLKQHDAHGIQCKRKQQMELQVPGSSNKGRQGTHQYRAWWAGLSGSQGDSS